MKIDPTTTLSELEVQLRSFALMLTCSLEVDGYVIAVVTDPEVVIGSARGENVADAIRDALEDYKITKTGSCFTPPGVH